MKDRLRKFLPWVGYPVFYLVVFALFTRCTFPYESVRDRVVAEFEANECLPDTLPDIAFVKANFSAGHITNQPLVGYFNEEGLLYADDSSCGQYIADNALTSLAAGPFAWMASRFALAVERGEIAPGKLGCDRWLSMIAEVLS